MKHLKPQYTFEKVPQPELDTSEIFPFTEDELDILSNFTFIKELHYNNHTLLISLGHVKYYGSGYIYKKPDEWYYVFCVDSMNIITGWKCDQLDGLIDCLKFIYNK